MEASSAMLTGTNKLTSSIAATSASAISLNQELEALGIKGK
jgi:hypothetical protein